MRVILLSCIAYARDLQFIYITCATSAELFQEVPYICGSFSELCYICMFSQKYVQ